MQEMPWVPWAVSLWRSNIKSQPIRAQNLNGSRPLRVVHSWQTDHRSQRSSGTVQWDSSHRGCWGLRGQTPPGWKENISDLSQSRLVHSGQIFRFCWHWRLLAGDSCHQKHLSLGHWVDQSDLECWLCYQEFGGRRDFIPENNVVFLQSFSLCFDLCSLHQLHVFHHNSLSVTEQKGSGLVLTKL